MLGAVDADQIVMILVLMVSSLLNIAYLLPLVARGFLLPTPAPASAGAAAAPASSGIREAPLFCVLAPCITAFGCLLLFFFADPLYELLSPMIQP
jgi:multicomponent Na+:H+ antiporter subunit D